MPRFKIETSLFEPVTIEIEGGRTYESVPLSPLLTKEVGRLEEQRKAGTLDDIAALTQQIALIFGLEPKDVERMDIRVLNRMLEDVQESMKGGRTGKVVEPASAESAEAASEKNAPKPEGEISQ
jgi:hypothetical protein